MSLPTTLKSLDLNYITMSDGISLNSYPSLVSFSLEDCDNIPYVDLNGCSALISCGITRNDALTSINISGCSSLTECDVVQQHSAESEHGQLFIINRFQPKFTSGT